MKTISSTIYQAFVLVVLASVALLPQVQAVVPAPDGGYPNYNTAEGEDALFALTTAAYYNTGLGWRALYSNTYGGDNTAVGYSALHYNTTGYLNTAIGSQSLLINSTGTYNTATGGYSLKHNLSGNSNTAIGVNALYENTSGSWNTAVGNEALSYNGDGKYNTASGNRALFSTTTGSFNTANGSYGLFSNTSGGANVAIGLDALYSNIIGSNNTAVGVNALLASTGSNNVGLGANAGKNLTSGFGNVCIGAGIFGLAGESNTTRIRNVYSSVASGRAVYIDSNNKIGTLASTGRVKNDIKPLDKASEAVLALKPVSFRYKKEIDASGTLQFGLIAEEVADINADLVTRDSEGKPETVRYEAVNAMLLNEFLKEHRKNEEQQAKITELKSAVAQQQKDFQATAAYQQKQIEALTAGLQKVSALVELNKAAPQTVLNNQ